MNPKVKEIASILKENWRLVAITGALVLGTVLAFVFPNTKEVTGIYLLTFPAYLGFYMAYLLKKFGHKIPLHGAWVNLAVAVTLLIISVIGSLPWLYVAKGLVIPMLYYIPYYLGFLFSNQLEIYNWFTAKSGEA